MQHASTSSPALSTPFHRLVSYSRPLRGLSMLLEQRQLAMHQVRRRVRVEELCDIVAPLDAEEGESGRYHVEWTQGVLRHYELPSMALSGMTYLFFKDVATHDDGVNQVTEGPWAGEAGMFLNIHVTGYGCFQMAGRSHSIRAGDAYLFDPSVPHAWVNGDRGLARAVSYLMPRSLVPQLVAGSGV